MMKHQTSAIQSLLRRRGQMSTTAIVFLVMGIVFAVMVIVVGIIAVLVIGFGRAMIPAVQQARAAAQRTQSQNNLKQIALAMHNYHDTHQVFPMGGIYAENDEPFNAWMTSILPYIDHASLYNTIDFHQPWTAPSNQQVFQTVIPEYCNPNVSPENMTVGSNGAAHYAGNSQVLVKNRGFMIRETTDGTSNTILAGEVGSNFMAWGDPENRRDPANGFGATPEQFGPASPEMHGAQMAMMDGSVRFISENVNLQVLKALATPGGGEVVGEF